MPESCVNTGHCGTHGPGWLNGSHPSMDEGAVRRKVCFHWRSLCCLFETYITVRNCGEFFVYRLTPVHICDSRYCGNGLTPTPGSNAIFLTVTLYHKECKDVWEMKQTICPMPKKFRKITCFDGIMTQCVKTAKRAMNCLRKTIFCMEGVSVWTLPRRREKVTIIINQVRELYVLIGPYQKDQGPKFSKFGPEQTWLIRNLLHHWNYRKIFKNDFAGSFGAVVPGPTLAMEQSNQNWFISVIGPLN